ncbi:hypothetical protein GGI43DRAFT_237001 [Trichoderma evansii]
MSTAEFFEFLSSSLLCTWSLFFLYTYFPSFPLSVSLHDLNPTIRRHVRAWSRVVELLRLEPHTGQRRYSMWLSSTGTSASSCMQPINRPRTSQGSEPTSLIPTTSCFQLFRFLLPQLGVTVSMDAMTGPSALAHTLDCLFRPNLSGSVRPVCLMVKYSAGRILAIV